MRHNVSPDARGTRRADIPVTPAGESAKCRGTAAAGSEAARCQQRRAAGARSSARAAFTLIEIILVVVIMSIGAALVLPQLSETTVQAKDAALLMNLRILRNQIALFAAQHNGNVPGWNGTDPLLHFTAYTDLSGDVSLTPSPLFPLGPYIRPEGIENPFNLGTAIQLSTNPAGETPDPYLMLNGQFVGWFYDPQNGALAGNAQGNNAAGVPRISL